MGFTFTYSQEIPIGSPEDAKLGLFQLTGKVDSNVSLTIRPYTVYHNWHSKNNELIRKDSVLHFIKPADFFNKNASFSLLPVQITQQYNSHNPYGWNDGPMMAAKGYQNLISAGFYASVGPLEMQIQPEFLYSNNPVFENTPEYGNAPVKPYQKIFGGQSSIRLTAGVVSVGVSTENLWWGPGKFSALIMSNNAPGFLHGFIKTNRPIKTGIGSFEWQLIGAKLTSNNALAYENYNLKPEGFSPDEWRYLSAFVITYHPKWVPGLFLGFIRGLQRYNTDLALGNPGFVSKYFPILNLPFQKANVINDDNKITDQIASFFLRWVLKKSMAEFYVEYGYNDYGYNIRDYLMAPTHSAAYLAGFKKIMPLSSRKAIEFAGEITQMSQSPDLLVRDAGNWYIHGQILQGFTNNNQILGAGAGLGCNVQSAKITWMNGLKQLGFLFERVERDPQYHANHWVDLGIGILPQIKYNKITFSGKFQFINSSNYAWQKDVNRFNLHSRLSVQYSL